MAPEPVPIQFSSESLTVLNLCLAIIMLGVALDIEWKHFTQLAQEKKAIATGLFSQLILLPLITLIMILALSIPPGMALGMLLVACCPGGNVSNFFTHLARGHVTLSIVLTACSSLAAFLITPVSFFMWASFLPDLRTEVKTFEVDFFSIATNMVLILLLPVVVGMSLKAYLPHISKRISKPLRILSMIILTGFIIVAVINNQDAFAYYLGDVFWIVLLHNGLGLSVAYFFSKVLKNSESVNRTVAIETGIQNSGLGLVLIFNFFGGNPAMAVVAAWWGVWHLISGFAFASFMGKRPLVQMS